MGREGRRKFPSVYLLYNVQYSGPNEPAYIYIYIYILILYIYKRGLVWRYYIFYINTLSAVYTASAVWLNFTNQSPLYSININTHTGTVKKVFISAVQVARARILYHIPVALIQDRPLRYFIHVL